jgi:hypothetical protein
MEIPPALRNACGCACAKAQENNMAAIVDEISE